MQASWQQASQFDITVPLETTVEGNDFQITGTSNSNVNFQKTAPHLLATPQCVDSTAAANRDASILRAENSPEGFASERAHRLSPRTPTHLQEVANRRQVPLFHHVFFQEFSLEHSTCSLERTPHSQKTEGLAIGTMAVKLTLSTENKN